MVQFSDFYKSGRTVFSVEIFPPKTEHGVAALFAELAALKAIQLAFVSVTYGAMGATRELTKDLAIRIKRELGLVPAFHFTCVGSGQHDIENYVTDLAREGIDLVVALRGDKPASVDNTVFPADGFHFASELVSFLKTLHPFSMAVAGYPEKHPEAVSFDADLQNLKRKVEAGADVVITQLFFDNADYYFFVEKARSLGIRVPIIPGILPIQNLKQVQKITGLCGAKLPLPLQQKLEACLGDETAMRAVGIEHSTKQCRDLIQNDVPGIHFYALNKAYSVLQIVDAL